MTATIVTRVASATGAAAAAAALACARSEPDRAGLLIDLEARRAPRATLVASAGARSLEERLVTHLPEAGVVSRGSICQLVPPSDGDGIDALAAALPLADDSAAVVHLPPRLFQVVVEAELPRVGSVLLCADLATDRALTALAARDAMEHGLRLAVLKQPLGWLSAKRALAGLLPAGSSGGLSEGLCDRLLGRAGAGAAPSRRGVPSEDGSPPGRDQEAPARIQFRL